MLKILIWNAKGLTRRVLELKQFIKIHNIDIILISETHFTSNSFIEIPNYDVFTTNHPSGKGHGGTSIKIRKSIKSSEK